MNPMDENQASAIQDYLLPSLASKYQSQIDPDQLKKMEELLQAHQQQALNNKLTINPQGQMQLVNPTKISLQTEIPNADPVERDTRLAYRTAVQNSLNQQKSGIDQLQNQVNDIAKKPGEIDWSPLASYFDSTVEGSKLSQGYKAPESQEQKDQRVALLNDQIQKSRQGLSDKEIDAMKVDLNAALTNKMIASQGRDARFKQANDIKMEKEIGQDLTKLSDANNEHTQNLTTLDENMASGSYAKISNSLANFSRNIAGEKGVLTDKDLERVLPKNIFGTLAKFESYFTETPDAALDPKYTKALNELIATARTKTAQRMNENLDQRETRWGNPASAYASVYNSVGRPQVDAIRKRVETVLKPQAPAGGAASPETKVINGVTYNRVNGQWHEQ